MGYAILHLKRNVPIFLIALLPDLAAEKSWCGVY